jgi:hypothetical protein
MLEEESSEKDGEESEEFCGKEGMVEKGWHGRQPWRRTKSAAPRKDAPQTSGQRTSDASFQIHRRMS